MHGSLTIAVVSCMSRFSHTKLYLRIIAAPCAHMFCKVCLLSEFQEQVSRSNKRSRDSDKRENSGALKMASVGGGSCPVCHEWVKTECIIQIERSDNGVVAKYLNQKLFRGGERLPDSENMLNRDVMAREALESAINGASSSKLEAILVELDEVWRDDSGSKVLIYSQYLGFLDLLGRALDNIGVECFRIDGKMSLKERVAMIGKFNKKKLAKRDIPPMKDGVCERGSVFLVSMKAGGVGLNLVAASSVFIVDPWWNQAIEDQCINRIHRIGQQAKVVRVRKFVVTDSVEEKIVNLQGKKKVSSAQTAMCVRATCFHHFRNNLNADVSFCAT
jgi:SNF2 family DNA or RNA helicase